MEEIVYENVNDFSVAVTFLLAISDGLIIE
jgi:hypothetical protein